MSKYDYPFRCPGKGLDFDTPTSLAMSQLMGIAVQHEGVGFTHTQDDDLRKFYGFLDEEDIRVANQTAAATRAKYMEQLSDWEEASKTAPQTPEHRAAWAAYHEKWGAKSAYRRNAKPEPPDCISSLPCLRAGSTVNVYRWVQRDGLRVMAFLSRYLEKGQDPVKLVAQ